jgi:hypothetical protein
MSTDKASSFANTLRIRVNPVYDHEADPESQEFAYWNPVSATNDLIKLANAALETTQVITDAMRKRTMLKIQLRAIEGELETLEHTVLVAEPLSPTEAKTLKTVAAALERRFESQGYQDAAHSLQHKRNAVLNEITKLDDRISAGHEWNKTNERVSDNIKTALSFFKDERKRAYQF